MNKNLKITLRSDLCAGVGKHFAAIIDLDTALDEYGLPYIPSRRLKGCLREIAEMFLDVDTINKLFGVSGSNSSGSIHIGDARVKDYDDVVKAIKSDKTASPEKITELFCSVRGETAIENDTAKDGSLRYIRVVNMLSPIDGEPLEFIAPIDFDCDEAIMKKIVSGLRNIGYHRNRGLGTVKCTLSDSVSTSDEGKKESLDPNEEYELRYTVKLVGDLMLPNANANFSMDYIPGTMVLGALAGRFAKKYPSADFNGMFYSDDVKFSNLYISDSLGNRFVPAPRFLAKIKAASTEEDKGIKNLIGKQGDGKQYKPLKTEYVNKQLGKKAHPERKIVYHNANTKSKEDHLLYMQYCICSDQYFSGSIIASGEKMSVIKELLSDNTLFFGRSKTAQYARCEICKTETVPHEIKTVSVKKGIAAYVLESDTVLIDKSTGAFSEELSVLCDYLKLDAEKLRPETSIASKKISGYNSKWNMKKPQFPVFCAGSCLVFECDSETTLPEYICIGEKQNEGFGLIKLISEADTYTITKKDDASPENETHNFITDLINKAERKDFITEKAMDFAPRIKLNSSQVGRVTLMAKEANLAENDNYKDFMKRLESIKTVSFREAAISYFDSFSIEKNLGISVSDSKSWDEIRSFIITALTVKKYLLRMEGRNND